MRLDPFIEAEKTAGRNVAKACHLLEVSKSAYYERRNGAPSKRELTDAALLEQIRAIHNESKGTYGSPRDAQRTAAPPRGLREASGDPAHASGRPRRALQEALAQDHGRRPRRPSWPATSSSATSARARRRTGATSATSPTSPPGRAGPTWRRSSTWPLAASSAGPWPITCAPSWSKTPSRWPLPSGHPKKGSSFIRTGAASTRVMTSPSWPGPTASCSRSGGRANAGITRWPNRFSPPSSASSSTTRPWPTRSRTTTRRLRLHRGLVQHPPAALDARLPQPRPVRSCPPQRRPSGGIINPSNLSVKADQAQRGGPGWEPV